jgi:serine/threonine protein kinase
MTATPNPGGAPSDVSVSNLCQRFIDALHKGDQPVIEEYLRRIPEQSRGEALADLLASEIAWRRQQGNGLDEVAYLARFPQDADLVRHVFNTEARIDTQDLAQASAGETMNTTPVESHPAPESQQTNNVSSTEPSAGRSQATSADRFGDYQLLEELGKGGMGIVYQARHVATGRVVALKLILPELLAQHRAEKRREMLARFRNEVLATARLDHDHVVTVYEVGEIQGQPYYTMRYVDGVSLRDLVKDRPLEPMVAARYVEQAARGLAAAHAIGVLHRDLKPHNVLVDRKTDRAQLADFGLAKLAESEEQLTASEAALGSPPYMSPEQFQDTAKVTAASDIYGLGATLYHLLTGRPPFQAANFTNTMMQVVSKEPVSPHELNPAVPRDLETICLKCLEKEQERRYASALDVADRLSQVQRGEPILERPIGRTEKLRRWCRRNPMVAGLCAVIASILLLSTILSAWLAVRATNAEARAIADRNAKASALEQLETSLSAQTKARHAEAAQRNRAETAVLAERNARLGEVAQRRRAEAVSKYLVDVFRSPDPKRDGRTITVAEMLDRARENLIAQFEDDPAAKAALLFAIGESYKGLGLIEDSIVTLEEAAKLREAELGADHVDTITTMHALAHCYQDAGRRDDATRLLQETYENAKSSLGSDHATTIHYLQCLLKVSENATVADDVLKSWEEKLKEETLKLGADHPDTLATMLRLAGAYKNAGRHDAAIPLFEQRRRISENSLGPEHPVTLSLTSSLAQAYRSAGRNEEAVALLEHVLKLQKTKLGADHTSSLETMEQLATAYMHAGRLDDRIGLTKELLEFRSAKLGADHPHTLLAMSNLAMTYHVAGQLDKALPLLEEARTLRHDKLGTEHPATLLTMRCLAAAYANAGQISKAVALQQEVAQLQSAHRGAEHPDALAASKELELFRQWAQPLSDDEKAAMSAIQIWKYAKDESGSPGEFRCEDGQWVEIKQGIAGAHFEEKSRSDLHVSLYDPQRHLWVRLTSSQSYFSFDALAWHALHEGAPQ